MRGRLHKILERHHAGQLHLEAGAADRPLVMSDNIHAVQEHCLDGVLPGPQRERIITQRTKVRVQYQRWPGICRYVSVHSHLAGWIDLRFGLKQTIFDAAPTAVAWVSLRSTHSFSHSKHRMRYSAPTTAKTTPSWLSNRPPIWERAGTLYDHVP